MEDLKVSLPLLAAHAALLHSSRLRLPSLLIYPIHAGRTLRQNIIQGYRAREMMTFPPECAVMPWAAVSTLEGQEGKSNSKDTSAVPDQSAEGQQAQVSG